MLKLRTKSKQIFRISAGALLLLGVAVLTWPDSQPANAQPDRLVVERPISDLISPDSAGFVTIRVSEIWNDPSLKEFQSLVLTNTPLKDLEKEMGITINDVESVTFLWPDFPQGNSRRGPEPGGILIRTKESYIKAKILTALRAASPKEGRFGRSMMSTRAMSRPASKMEMKKDGYPYPSKDAPFKDSPKVEYKKADIYPVKDAPKSDRFEEKRFKDDFTPPKGGFEKAVPKGDPVPFKKEPPKIPEFKPDLDAPYHFVGEYVLYCLDSKTLLMALADDRDTSLTSWFGQLLKPVSKGPLSTAIAASKEKHAISGGVNIDQFRGILPKPLPRDLTEFRSIVESHGADFTFDIGKELTVKLRVESKDATDVADLARGLLVRLRSQLKEIRDELKKEENSADITKLLDIGESVLKNAKVTTAEGSASLVLSVPMDDTVQTAVKAAVKATRESADRSRYSNNLKQMGLAMHSYYDANQAFPFPGTGEKGGRLKGPNDKPLLSWRVAILPYIEHSNLYLQFKLDEPWDSEHNKKLIPLMPKIYAPPANFKADPGTTCWQTFSGPMAVTPNLRFPGITDGTSNTIAIAESATPVIWTKPDDMPFDPKGPLPKLGAFSKSGFWVVMFDGSVRMIPATVSPATLKNAITPNGGEVLGPDWYGR